MSGSRRVLLVIMLMVLLVSGAPIGFASGKAIQEAAPTAAGLVSGPWRIMALQTVVADEVPEAGLEAAPQGTWALVVADVTNTGVSSIFDPTTLEVGTVAGSPLSMTNGVAGDTASSTSASQTLALQGVTPEGTFPVGENATIRLSVAFPLASGPAEDESLVMRLNDQVMELSGTRVEALAVAQLPPLVTEMQLEVADITNAVGGGKVDVALRSGGNATINMDSVISPEAEADVRSSCYSGESATQVMNLTGGTVWIEQVPGSGESLIWFNDPATASFGLLNAHLIAGGFAGVDPNSISPYVS
jgi:hypothetical protein